jgi:WXG100 family type VII secretion target
MSLQVNIEELAAAGVAVTGHGEDVAVAHTAADGRIDAAQAGWQGRSAAALAAKTAQWAADSRAMLARLSDHAQGLHTAATEFWAHEQRSAQALNSLR